MKEATAGWLAVAIAAVWGGSFLLMQTVADEIAAAPYIFLRFGVAFVVLIGLFGRSLQSLRRKTILGSLGLGTVMFIYMLFQFFALETTSSSNTAFLSSSSFLMVPFLAAVFLKKKPTLGNTLGLLLTAMGLVWMTGGMGGGFTRGDFYAIISAVMVAVHIVLVDKTLGDTNTAERFEQSLGIGILQVGVAAAWALIFWQVFTPHGLTFPLSATLLISVAGTGIFCSAFCFTAQLIVQQKLSPSRFVLLLMLEPLFALLYSMVFPIDGVVEMLNFDKIGGVFLVLAGMAVSESDLDRIKVKRKRKR